MKHLTSKDISPRLYWAAVVLVFAAKVLLSRFQMFYTWVGGAPIDDELMFRAAQAVTAGQWLGAYDWLTLSKHMLFPLWLALLHGVGLPYLAANQLLWCAAALAMAEAFRPALSKNLTRLGLFAALAFLPSAMAGFTLRVYRDSIFPALCLLFFAGMVGYALRSLRPKGLALGWLLLAGLGLLSSWLCREDGYWLLPFALVGSAVVGWQLVKSHMAKRLVCLLLPFGVLAAGLAGFCAINQQYYGIFAVSDFSSGSFADAMGAMTRVKEEDFTPLVTVPYQVRRDIYAATDAMDALEPYLEEDAAIKNSYSKPESGDYQAGGYYWAVRLAAQKAGKYTNAQTAQTYWAQVAEEINTACEDGTLPSEGRRRSGTAPAIRAEYILPVLGEGLHSLWFCATFQDCAPYYPDLRSIGTPEDLAAWEGYLHDHCNYAAQAGTDLPYYSPLQKLAYLGLNVIRCAYALVLPLALLLAAVLQFCKAKALLRQSTPAQTLCWWVLLGLLGMGLLRTFLIAFMEIAAFRIGTYVMYLATVHPLLLLFAYVGIATGWEARPWQK